MSKKMLVLMAVLVIASLGLTSVASAQSEDGMGTLVAEGDGFAGLHGTGYIRVSGTGVLWVKGEEVHQNPRRGPQEGLP